MRSTALSIASRVATPLKETKATLEHVTAAHRLIEWVVCSLHRILVVQVLGQLGSSAAEHFCDWRTDLSRPMRCWLSSGPVLDEAMHGYVQGVIAASAGA